MGEPPAGGLIGRVRAASTSLIKTSPQPGMWQATGTAITQAPTLVELREPVSGGSNITFDGHGHSARIAKSDEDGGLVLIQAQTKQINELPSLGLETPLSSTTSHGNHHGVCIRTLHEKHKSDVKEKWGPTILHGIRAFWRFFITPPASA